MAIFERIWDLLGVIFGGSVEKVGQVITGVVGSANARTVARLTERAAKITALEPRFAAMSDEELRLQSDQFRAGSAPAKRSTTSWRKPSPSAAKAPSGTWGCVTTTSS